MTLVVTAVLMFVAGRAATRRIAAGPMERWTYAAVAGLTAWLASTWLLALTHTMTRPFLIARLVLLLVVVAVVTRERIFAFRFRADLVALWLLPVVAWIGFTLWRGAVIPPVSHDALSYHLPKATLFARAAGFRYFSELIPAIRTLPVNYELLLTEMIVWSGNDGLTEWISLIFFLLFAISSAALAERWWGVSAVRTTAILLLSCGLPVVLLHSGAHKNDLMVASLMTSSLVAVSRWFDDRNRDALFLGILALALAIGTKPQAGALALALAPFILMTLIRQPRMLAAIAGLSIAGFLLLGGIAYVTNYAHEGSILNAKDVDEVSVEIVPYGDWRTLWQGPYVLVAAPFSRSQYSLAVPWETKPWFWRRYEIYFSHLGVAFSLALLALPIAMFAARRSMTLQRAAVTAATLVTFVVMLPVGFRPHGLYTISLPRYALFIVPVVFAWTVGRLSERIAALAAPVAAALFTMYGIDCAIHDAFAPLSYVRWAAARPGTRAVLFDPNRAASIADRAAGPRDRIAIDAGFGTWIHPAFGRDLGRPVEFIPGGDGPPVISSSVRWVAVDRAYTAVWQHPDFDDLSEARQYLLRGTPSARDTRVIDALRRDSRWETVFYNPRMVQAVFRRR